ncbi:MAG: HAD-superfamily hydrolase, subfamily [Anaerocolumna sp.]|jgi:Cof subfamily protein (haloacid dehalogenase superfamily)|nr:HAD-superfamily hydrolase, subfamily [Anaerocolumna sp.]
MKTLYVSDLDGTLLNKDAVLSSYTIETINDLIKKGLSFSVATARSAATVRKILEPLNLSIPVVLMNGVVIYDLKTDQYLNINYLTKSSLDYVYNTLKSISLSGFLYEIKDNTLCTYYENLHNKAMKEFHDERVTLYNKKFVQVEDFKDIISENTIYITLMDTEDRLVPIYEQLRLNPDLSLALYKDIYSKEDSWFLEVFSVKATKYNAVTYLRNHLQYEKIVGFGDNTNDLPLFKACDTALAVGNAIDEVKTAADCIIESNADNGVAKYLRREFNDSY